MARKKPEEEKKARKLYAGGMKLKDIAQKIGKPEGTIRRWKCNYDWDKNQGERSEKITNARNDKNKTKKSCPLKEQEMLPVNDELTDKQMLFCIYYIKCFNATKAYKKAYGCEYNVAAAAGSRLLKNVKIKNEIQNLKQNRFNREMLSEDDIFQKYMDIAFADITDYVEIRRGHPVFRDSTEFDGTLVKKVTSGKTNSIELQDRMRALQWLSDHMNMATEKQRAEIAALRAKSGNENEEERERRQQAKDNITSILKQMQEVQEDDVIE